MTAGKQNGAGNGDGSHIEARRYEPQLNLWVASLNSAELQVRISRRRFLRSDVRSLARLAGAPQAARHSQTTHGHIDATVSFHYSEQTSDSASVTQGPSGTGPSWQRLSSATDTYSVTNSGTITYFDGVAMSCESFSMKIVSLHDSPSSLESARWVIGV
jgi:hypothetical protein